MVTEKRDFIFFNVTFDWSMKSAITKLVVSIAGNNFSWVLLDKTLGRLSRSFIKIEAIREKVLGVSKPSAAFESTCSQLIGNLKVLHGPFKGLRYPHADSVGSSLLPKLLGSYESELSGVIDIILGTHYTAIVDIGCAEGYYIVGFGLHFKNSRLFAFDTDAHARKMCQEMADLNQVRLDLGSFCDQSLLAGLSLGERALIFCDCEGYEKQLISSALAEKLKNHDFLIETHDFIEIDITKGVLEAFEMTHCCELIESIDDIIKAYTYSYPELEPLDLSERNLILAEGRPRVMRWIFAKSISARN